MIWKLWQAQRMIREGRENPAKFAGGEVRDVVLGILIIPGLVIIGTLILLGIAGFSHFLGGPYLLFKILFWIGLIISFVLGSIAYVIIRGASRLTKHIVERTISYRDRA